MIRLIACLVLALCAFALTAPRAEARCWPVARGGAAVVRGVAKAVLPPYPVARKAGAAVLGVERRQSRRAAGCGLFGCR